MALCNIFLCVFLSLITFELQKLHDLRVMDAMYLLLDKDGLQPWLTPDPHYILSVSLSQCLSLSRFSLILAVSKTVRNERNKLLFIAVWQPLYCLSNSSIKHVFSFCKDENIFSTLKLLVENTVIGVNWNAFLISLS